MNMHSLTLVVRKPGMSQECKHAHDWTDCDFLETRLVHRHGMGKRAKAPGRLTWALLIGGLVSLACPAMSAAQCPVSAWTGMGPAGCGIMIGNRAYLPGLTLTPDMALYVGDDPEEPAEFTLCLQHAHGVVCQGVKP